MNPKIAVTLQEFQTRLAELELQGIVAIYDDSPKVSGPDSGGIAAYGREDYIMTMVKGIINRLHEQTRMTDVFSEIQDFCQENIAARLTNMSLQQFEELSTLQKMELLIDKLFAPTMESKFYRITDPDSHELVDVPYEDNCQLHAKRVHITEEQVQDAVFYKGETCSSSKSGFSCTRSKGHTGPHIAIAIRNGTDYSICDVWED